MCFVEGETVSAIGKSLGVLRSRGRNGGRGRVPGEGADRVIDASGLLVMPGGVDPHVHLDMPFMGTFSSDTHETGTRAALFGGTTMVIDFVLQKQGHSLRRRWRNGMAGRTERRSATMVSIWR